MTSLVLSETALSESAKLSLLPVDELLTLLLENDDAEDIDSSEVVLQRRLRPPGKEAPRESFAGPGEVERRSPEEIWSDNAAAVGLAG
mmetsp:Transcript_34402/g.53686  ORF Transcript_34402/g.53686 Transcript_34402/m.53686 type:complete len:88 (-) Transcript_34402:268-531(-)